MITLNGHFTFCFKIHVVSQPTTISGNATKVRAKLHYTDTGYEHQLRTPLTDKNLPHPNILTCRDVGLWHCDVANFSDGQKLNKKLPTNSLTNKLHQ